MKQFLARLRLSLLPLGMIDRNLPKEGTIFDLGCGQGIIATALAEVPARTVIGVDIDAARIRQAQDTNAKPNLSFREGSATEIDLGSADGVIMSDALHHVVPVSSHIDLFTNVYKSLRPGGVFIIKEVDRSERIRAALSRLWDKLLYPKDIVFYYNYKDMIRILENVGFEVKMSREIRIFPGSTTVYVGRKA